MISLSEWVSAKLRWLPDVPAPDLHSAVAGGLSGAVLGRVGVADGDSDGDDEAQPVRICVLQVAARAAGGGGGGSYAVALQGAHSVLVVLPPNARTSVLVLAEASTVAPHLEQSTPDGVSARGAAALVAANMLRASMLSADAGDGRVGDVNVRVLRADNDDGLIDGESLDYPPPR
ncbi:hypothetical protein T492DRAFT_874055 [Pavlovales sp. CCMP2436]|nr:hypothetical protein T492DRAFT_874055 [Pavlovales sp. CCMP2436]